MKSNKNMRRNIIKMYSNVAKNLITIAIYKSVLKSLRLSQRDIKMVTLFLPFLLECLVEIIFIALWAMNQSQSQHTYFMHLQEVIEI